MSNPSPRLATVYLQVANRAPRGDWNASATVVKSTTFPPEVVEPGCVVVKIGLRIPREAWQPFQPEAVIDVPAELVQRPIEVEAVEP